jgi:hypothetical protein
MTLPPLCKHHAGVYATRLAALRRRFRYPGSGRKALAREAETVRRQCPWCP